MADILWAEDSAQDQQLVRAALEELPRRPRITFVEDGQAALEALRGSKVRLLVLDLQMPRVGGLEALQRLRAAPATRDLPVVIFTSSNHPRDVSECQRLGVTDFVTKPMEFGAFCKAVERVVSSLAVARVR